MLWNIYALHIYLFRKIIGYKLYHKNSKGIDTYKFNAFYDDFTKGKYKNHLIIMDNAKFHKSIIIVKNNIENSKNKIIYILLNKTQN